MQADAHATKALPKPRLETISRSEQDHMSTLKLVLLADPSRGIDAFLNLLDRPAPEACLFESFTSRVRCPLPPKPEHGYWTPERFQFGLEVRLSDDLMASRFLKSSELSGRQIPDAILMLSYPDGFWHAIVIEAKLLNGTLSVGKLDSQMADQRDHQIHLLRRFEPTLRTYRHIALIPRPLRDSERLDNADGWLTWADIASLANRVLGPDHYASRQLATTVARCEEKYSIKADTWEYVVGIDKVIALCEQSGDAIEIGCDRSAGGRERLQRTPLAVLRRRTQPWKVQRSGIGDARDWVTGDEFLRLIDVA